MSSTSIETMKTLLTLFQTVTTLEQQSPGTTALVVNFLSLSGRDKAPEQTQDPSQEPGPDPAQDPDQERIDTESRLRARRAIQTLFQSIDVDDDGKVCRQELLDRLQSDEHAVLQTLLEYHGCLPDFYVLEQLDLNKDGFITLDEFEAVLGANTSPKP